MLVLLSSLLEHACHSIHEEVRRWLPGEESCLPPHGSQRWNPNCHGVWQVPLPGEPSFGDTKFPFYWHNDNFVLVLRRNGCEVSFLLQFIPKLAPSGVVALVFVSHCAHACVHSCLCACVPLRINAGQRATLDFNYQIPCSFLTHFILNLYIVYLWVGPA